MKTAANACDSALPLQSDQLKYRVLRKAAEFMLTDEYKNLMSEKRLGAIIQTNRAIYESEKEAV